MVGNKNTLFNIPEFDAKSHSVIGDGQRGLLCIFASETYGMAEETTLKRLVTAIKYDFDKDIFLVIINNGSSFSLGNLSVQYKDMISFGVLPEQIGLNVDYKMYEILRFDQMSVLISDSIRDINAFPQKKQQLWVKLQQMFLS